MKEREETITPQIFAVVDVETSGMRPDRARIIDIAVIRMENGVVTKRFSTLVNPGVPLTATTFDISGITNEDVATAPPFEEIALELEALFEGAVFVAHNVAFDYGFVRAEFARLGMKFSHPTLCTVKLSRTLSPGGRHDLDSLIFRHRLTCETRHRALPDAEVVVQYLELLEGNFEAKMAMSKQLASKQSLPLHTLPDTPGIYFFYGVNRELLYVGKSKNIRTRVRSHFSDRAYREEKLCRETASIEARTTPGELSALLLEAHTIKRELPHYNRAQRRKKELVSAHIEVNGDGYKTVSFGRVQKVEPSNAAMLFRTLPAARLAMKKIAETGSLCLKFLGVETTSNRCFRSQIGRCSACTHGESCHEYNARFDSAIKKRRLRTWPYKGGIMIEERGGHQDEGVVFLVRDWCLLGSYLYTGGSVSEFIPSTRADRYTFDYDTYKILARYLLNTANRNSIRVLGDVEFTSMLRQGEQGDEAYESVIQYA